MNFYLEALQDEHQLLLKALPGYRGAVEPTFTVALPMCTQRTIKYKKKVTK